MYLDLLFIMHHHECRQICSPHSFTHFKNELTCAPALYSWSPNVVGRRCSLGRSHKKDSKTRPTGTLSTDSYDVMQFWPSFVFLTWSNSLCKSKSYEQRNIAVLIALVHMLRDRSHLLLFSLIHYLLHFINSCASARRNKNKSWWTLQWQKPVVLKCGTCSKQWRMTEGNQAKLANAY